MRTLLLLSAAMLLAPPVAAQQRLVLDEALECGAADADGLPDACECADVSDDGVLIARHAAGQGPELAAADRCALAGTPDGCEAGDALRARQVLAGALEAATLACRPVLP